MLDSVLSPLLVLYHLIPTVILFTIIIRILQVVKRTHTDLKLSEILKLVNGKPGFKFG